MSIATFHHSKLYFPRSVRERLGLRDGMKVELTVTGDASFSGVVVRDTTPERSYIEGVLKAPLSSKPRQGFKRGELYASR
jgi:bifunctional DNA-binding transcriptional regulator/antitoxin component of YhaV-PrlF toxin-antitoxin module